MSEPENVTGVWVSLQEAAQRRGVSPDTIRNWIKARKVQSRRKELPQGFAYEVFLVDLESVEIIPPSPNAPLTSESPGPNAVTSWEPRSVDLTPLADLVRELASRVAELERENGALTEKLSCRDRTPDLPPSRPWWQWWRRNPQA